MSDWSLVLILWLVFMGLVLLLAVLVEFAVYSVAVIRYFISEIVGVFR